MKLKKMNFEKKIFLVIIVLITILTLLIFWQIISYKVCDDSAYNLVIHKGDMMCSLDNCNSSVSFIDCMRKQPEYKEINIFKNDENNN